MYIWNGDVLEESNPEDILLGFTINKNTIIDEIEKTMVSDIFNVCKDDMVKLLNFIHNNATRYCDKPVDEKYGMPMMTRVFSRPMVDEYNSIDRVLTSFKINLDEIVDGYKKEFIVYAMIILFKRNSYGKIVHKPFNFKYFGSVARDWVTPKLCLRSNTKHIRKNA